MCNLTGIIFKKITTLNLHLLSAQGKAMNAAGQPSGNYLFPKEKACSLGLLGGGLFTNFDSLSLFLLR